MTARDIVNHTLISNKRLKGFDDISDFGVDVLIDMMNKYARQMCDKQREICASNAIAYIHSYDQPVVNKKSILNAPCPEELI